MKKILLIALVFNFTILCQAQTETYFIDWSFDSNPSATGDANTNRTIEVGDTVIWTWYASGTHSVVSENDATESFDSGLQNSGATFSFTFTLEGTNDYFCGPHPSNMFGTITVVPDGTLSTNEFFASENIKVYPNPAQNILHLDFEESIAEDLKVSIYNTLGQLVHSVNNVTERNNSFDISSFNSGIYLLRVEDASSSITKRFLVR